jgi:hypothetical protein
VQKAASGLCAVPQLVQKAVMGILCVRYSCS